jgi:Ca-activated chloride channel family protein
VKLAVHLNAGFPLGEVKSHHHKVKINGEGDKRTIKLDGIVPADRDFELTWKGKNGNTPSAGLFREKLGGDDYILTLVTPPKVIGATKPRAREIVFVIDNSGSMGGASIVQAKASLMFGLDHLKPGDSFNIVRFDDTLEVLFPKAVPADGENIAKAKSFVSSLDASGGTEMVPAMAAALMDGTPEADTLRQVVFLTDGGIGNEKQLFDTISAQLGRSRVFMVGIGSAPNSYLMTHAAELGRGTFTHIGSSLQVEERMRELFAKLERPAVTDITVSFSEGGADVTPKLVPDLYAGETLQIAAKLASLKGTVEIKGMIGGNPWVAKMQLAQAVEGKGLSKVWARAKLNDAEVAMRLGHITQSEGDKRILALALEHSLLSRLTSLVAVDKTPSRPKGARLTRADIPLNLPAGWEFDKVFGEKRPGVDQGVHEGGGDSEDAPQLIEAKYEQAIATHGKPVAANVKARQRHASVPLPQTATDAEISMLAGLLLLLAGMTMLLIVRHRRHAAVRIRNGG